LVRSQSARRSIEVIACQRQQTVKAQVSGTFDDHKERSIIAK
jgi:hypothetical protein